MQYIQMKNLCYSHEYVLSFAMSDVQIGQACEILHFDLYIQKYKSKIKYRKNDVAKSHIYYYIS